MDIVLVLARLLLSVIFGLSGLAKLVDLSATRQAVREFGVPRPVVYPLAVLLPVAEVAVAIFLVPVVSARWSATGALALLGVFFVAIVVNLARGRKPDCHCFGQLHSRPI